MPSYWLEKLQQDAYLASRTAGDIKAARKGPQPLAKRVARRVYHRKLIGLLRRGGVW